MLTFVLVQLVLSSIVYSYPEGWSDDILLTPETPGYRLDPDISVDSYNNVWVVWDSNFWGSGNVYYSKRDSLGDCIIPETMLPDSMHSSLGQTKIVVDNSDNAHMQWTEPSATGYGIGYAKLNNTGSIIVNPHQAMPGYGGGSSCNRHEFAIDKYKNLNIVWDESPLETNQITFTKLDSLGDTIISRIRVSPVGLFSIWPGIGVDSFGNVHMAYRTDTMGTSNRLTYSKLDNNANILISNKVLGTGMAPTIICDRTQNIHMIYLSPTGSGNSIKYVKLDQAGNFLVSPQTISIHDNNNYPHMAMDSLYYLHVVWHLESPMGIVYAKLDTMGDYVVSPLVIVYPPYAVWPGLPRIAVDHSNRLHLVWMDQRLGSEDIYYKRGENETGIQETQDSKVEQRSRISVSPNPFHVVTKICFALSQDTESMKFEILDILGRTVKEFIPAESEGFTYWDGTDDIGGQLPAGVYFFRISSQKKEPAVPMVFLR